MTKASEISVDMIDSEAWRSFVPGPWILKVLRTSPPRSDQYLMLDRHRQQTDTVADDLVEAMRRRKNGGARAQVERAIEHGIEAVDDPMPELTEFIRVLEDRPFWVDDRLLHQAQRALSRIPVPVLAAGIASAGLPATYISFRANAVMMMAGDLDKKAPARLVETMAWMVECAQPGGLERFAPGFTTTARVRLMHAQIRAGIRKLDSWDEDELGVPLSQLQQGVVLSAFVSLLAILGGTLYSFTPREIRALLHLYRYLGYLMGVPAEMQITNLRDLARLVVMFEREDLGMDANGRQLTTAMHAAIPTILGHSPSGRIAAIYGRASHRFYTDLARVLLGRRWADAVGVDSLSPMVAILPLWAASKHLANDARTVRYLGRRETRLHHDAAARRRELQVFVDRVAADTSFLRDHAPSAIARNNAATQGSLPGPLTQP